MSNYQNIQNRYTQSRPVASLYSDPRATTSAASSNDAEVFNSMFEDETQKLTKKTNQKKLSKVAFKSTRLIPKLNSSIDSSKIDGELKMIEANTLHLRQLTGESGLINIYDIPEIHKDVKGLNMLTQRYAASAYTLTDTISKIDTVDDNKTKTASQLISNIEAALHSIQSKLHDQGALGSEFGNLFGDNPQLSQSHTNETLAITLENQVMNATVLNYDDANDPTSTDFSFSQSDFSALGANPLFSSQMSQTQDPALLQMLLPQMGIPAQSFPTGTSNPTLPNSGSLQGISPSSIPMYQQAQSGYLGTQSIGMQIGSSINMGDINPQ